MYKVLLVSHSGLSKGLLDATEMILGDADGVDYIILYSKLYANFV